ncbi:MAG: trigger factor [Mycobacteriales bacterium]
MKSTVETLSPTRVRLAVEVPFDELGPSIAKAYKSIAQQIKVPGFRPGKAPAPVIDRQVGRDAVLSEALQQAVPDAYSRAVQENTVKVMGQPDFEVQKIEDHATLEFTAEVDVRPELTLPELSAIAVTVDDAAVSDGDVDEQLTSLRERFGTLKSIERPAATGDFVSIDLSAEATGDPEYTPGEDEERDEQVEMMLNGLRVQGTSYEVGSDSLVPGLDVAITGLGVGESEGFDAELGDTDGVHADVTVTVRSVKERELPELDDDFAQTASEFDTLDELRDDVRGRLSRMRLAQQGTQARDKVLDALIEAGDVPLPRSAVDHELQWRRESLAGQLQGAGMDLDEYLAMQGEDTETFESAQREQAELAVRTQLVLDTIADDVEVTVSEADLTEHLVAEAQRYGLPPQELAQRVQQAGNLGALIAEVRRNKAMRYVLAEATVTEESGKVVDLTEILGPVDRDPEADAEIDAANVAGEAEADADAEDADRRDAAREDADTAPAGAPQP